MVYFRHIRSLAARDGCKRVGLPTRNAKPLPARPPPPHRPMPDGATTFALC
ncbi:MAG: hypothetical protein LBJ57_06515 [Prevotellaceae bacterium]|nr:hypothetical protein [Prevotellaceae bacterium]